MGTRTRIREVAGAEGSMLSTVGTTVTSTRGYEGSRHTCTDWVPGPDQALEVRHRWVDGCCLSFHYIPDPAQPQRFTSAKAYPMVYWINGSNAAHLSIPDRPSNSFLAVKLIAATNPSKPVVDLPVSFLELRELPRMLHTVGNTLIKTWAKKNLNREFGLTPLMDDALKLLSFTDEVAKRVELFKKLREKSLLRKATLWKGSVFTEPGTTITSNSSPTRIQTRHRCTGISTKVTIGGYVRWTPTSDFSKTNLAYSDPALEYLARRAVTGTQLGLVTAWNALPWTWLADWFGNMGDYLEGNRSVVPVTPSLPRLTIRSDSQTSWVLDSSNVGLPPGSVPVTEHLQSKVRTIASASLPSAYMPFLTARQVGILASLAALRL